MLLTSSSIALHFFHLGLEAALLLAFGRLLAGGDFKGLSNRGVVKQTFKAKFKIGRLPQ